MDVRRVDLANWAIRTSPNFTAGVKYQFHQGFDQIRDPEIPFTLRLLEKYIMGKIVGYRIQERNSILDLNPVL